MTIDETKAVNILFTSVGRRVELIRSFRTAYQEMQLEGAIIAVDIDPLAPALQEVDRAYIVPKVNDPSYATILARICRTERADLIFPCIDPDISVLARHREELERHGTRVAVVSQEAAATTADKWLTYQFFNQLDIPTPYSWIPDHGSELSTDFPLFIKPRAGSAAKDSFKVNNESELAFFLNYVPDPIVQEFLAGPEITHDVACDFTGRVMSVVSRERIEVRWGEVAKGKTVLDPAQIEYCVKIANGLNAVGPITVQCILKEGKPYFTEVNPRFGGGVVLATVAGVPLPNWYISLAGGMSVEPPPLGSYQKGLYITRFDDSHFLTQEDNNRIASNHI